MADAMRVTYSAVPPPWVRAIVRGFVTSALASMLNASGLPALSRIATRRVENGGSPARGGAPSPGDRRRGGDRGGHARRGRGRARGGGGHRAVPAAGAVVRAAAVGLGVGVAVRAALVAAAGVRL